MTFFTRIKIVGRENIIPRLGEDFKHFWKNPPRSVCRYCPSAAFPKTAKVKLRAVLLSLCTELFTNPLPFSYNGNRLGFIISKNNCLNDFTVTYNNCFECFYWTVKIIRGRYFSQNSRKNVDNRRELWESQMLNINDRGVLQWDFNFAKTVVPLALVIIWNRKTKQVAVMWDT